MEKVTLSTPARVSASLVELHSLGVIGSRDQENIGLINNSLDDFKLGGDRGGVKGGGEEEEEVRGLHSTSQAAVLISARVKGVKLVKLRSDYLDIT